MSEVSKPIVTTFNPPSNGQSGELPSMNPSYQLDGTNYLQWSQIVKTFLKEKGKLSHLNGTGPRQDVLNFQLGTKKIP